MKLTKGRIHKLFFKENQTRKQIKKTIAHTNCTNCINNSITLRQKKQFNLRNHTIRMIKNN